MKDIRKLFIVALVGLILTSFTASDSATYKCLIQLQNYTGLGAYIVVSVVDGDNHYQQTLQVLGPDDEWYPDWQAWWHFREKGKHNPSVDAITGASIQRGERSVFTMNIDKKYIDSGHVLRFESAVEDQEYHKSDLEFELTSANLKGKFDGTGYIRYVRVVPPGN